MHSPEIIPDIKGKLHELKLLSVVQEHPDQLFIKVNLSDFKNACLKMHSLFLSPVMLMSASDERCKTGCFCLRCIFLDRRRKQWIVLETDVPQEKAGFDSLSKEMHSAILFEREIREMFGIEPSGHPDPRQLHLHNEVWPAGEYPLRKDFKPSGCSNFGSYKFLKVEGEGIFEVPVGPVHAGIIGPGYFRFSVAGEPIVQLETRLGFTHKGVEKLFEGKTLEQGLALSECVSGDTAFGHSLAFTGACEKILRLELPKHAQYARAICLELERLYNHAGDIGGIALDVGFSFPAALASVIKESLLRVNEAFTGSRYLKNVNRIGGIELDITEKRRKDLLSGLEKITADFNSLSDILMKSVSFMDRVDKTGVLKKKTAQDLGVVGLAARASGIPIDLRKDFPGAYHDVDFRMFVEEQGDVLSRLKVRLSEFRHSCELIKEFMLKGAAGEEHPSSSGATGKVLGYAEAWRGPVLYWLETTGGTIERCKIVDPSFHNWPGLSYAVLENIIPDFPLCNKSFDLSYSGNDL